jgi:hypothetical protein
LRNTSSVTAKSAAYFSNSASSRISGSKLGISDSTAFRTFTVVIGNFRKLRRSREASHSQPITASSFPEKFRWPIDFGRQTFVHRTVERSLLQHLTVR